MVIDTAGRRSLHVGCGPWAKDGDVGIDILAGPAVDIVHDLNRVPWPLDDDDFGVVICNDVLEHLIDIPAVISEIHRVSRDGALVFIKVPTGTSPDLFTDPTHIRGFGYRSFDYWDPDNDYYDYGYTDLRIHVESFESTDSRRKFRVRAARRPQDESSRQTDGQDRQSVPAHLRVPAVPPIPDASAAVRAPGGEVGFGSLVESLTQRGPTARNVPR
jgi:SAM-dependent methyltransferase